MIEKTRQGTWRARLLVDGKRVSLGVVTTEEEAKRFVEVAKQRLEEDRRADLRELAGEAKSRIYVVQEHDETGWIKIGRATNVAARMLSMQTSNHRRMVLLACFPGGPQVECAIHRAFADERQRGEWFEPSRRLLAFAREMASMFAGAEAS